VCGYGEGWTVRRGGGTHEEAPGAARLALARRAAELVVEHDDESVTRAVAVDAADEGTKVRVRCVLSGLHLTGTLIDATI
jgi:hypothetical protein